MSATHAFQEEIRSRVTALKANTVHNHSWEKDQIGAVPGTKITIHIITHQHKQTHLVNAIKTASVQRAIVAQN